MKPSTKGDIKPATVQSRARNLAQVQSKNLVMQSMPHEHKLAMARWLIVMMIGSTKAKSQTLP